MDSTKVKKTCPRSSPKGNSSTIKSPKCKFKAKSPKTPNVAQLTPQIIVQKVIQHAKGPESPRLLRYLQHLRKCCTSSDLKLWKELRLKGGLAALQSIVRQYALTNATTATDNDHEVLIISLSILGNAFSLDYSARKEVAANGFVEVLHSLIKKQSILIEGESPSQQSTPTPAEETTESRNPPFTMTECDIKTKTVKCIANLSHDSTCRNIIFRSGVGISMLRMVENFNCYLRAEIQYQLKQSNSSVGKKSEYFQQCVETVKSSIRAIRILSAESFCNEEAKSHLIRFRAVITVGHVLCWTDQEDVKLDVVRSLANLTDKIRLLPSEQVFEMISEDNRNNLLKNLITVFDQHSTTSKLFSPAIRCITNLASNTQIADAMGRLQVFKAVLDKLDEASEKSSTEVCRLLVKLTKHSSLNKCILNNCHEVWTTLNIFKCKNLKEYHHWILQVYQSVHGGSLKSLLKNGLIQLLDELFKAEIDDCDFEVLKHKITLLEDGACGVHNNICQFIPTYRCDSPSYQQVKEEVKIFLKDRDKLENDSGSSGFDSSSSPSSSPARSWSSDDSCSETGVRASSPFSEDEGCYSPVDSSCLTFSPTYVDPSPDSSFNSEQQQAKFPRLDPSASTSMMTTSQIISRKASDSFRNQSKKIVTMLKILQNVTFLIPMPQQMVNVVPILLSFIVRGIVSLTPQRCMYEDYSQDLEMVQLGRQSFSLAYRILKSICLNISFFPELVKNGTIFIISRLLPWDKLLIQNIQIESIQSMAILLNTLRGDVNQTSGWREGYLMRTLLISKNEEELNKVSLSIPLLFRNNNHVLRSFEMKGNSWTRVFQLLVTKVDELDTPFLQDCILTLSTLSETIGMKYDISHIKNRPMLLFKPNANQVKDVLQFIDGNKEMMTRELANISEGKVEITLDDGSSALVLKSVLTEASPVFLAMFDGYFREAGSQKVKIKNVSRKTLEALITQLVCIPSCDYKSSNYYDLSTLFELISLSDQFLLESVYEKTLNTLLCNYICPYSAPKIYEEAVKLAVLWKPQSRLKRWDMDLSFVVLKYLLVGDVAISVKCGAFRKIFDNVPLETVVGDMRALVEFYSTRPV